MLRHASRPVRRRAGSLILIVAIGLFCIPSRLAAEVPAGKVPMSALQDTFARALYAQLAQQHGNLAVSPASVRACVLLALAGAEAKRPGRLQLP